MAYIRENVLNTREIGALGELAACKWLENHGFLIAERNYLKKWGEIDIIATKDKILHFVEVKSIKTTGNSTTIGHRPEENVHELKLRRLRRVIQTYLNEHHYHHEAEFKFHVMTVVLDTFTRRARVNFLENIVL
jgi:putative endonuclease